MNPDLCLLRGGGDLATGIAWRLTRAGWPVVVCELAEPLTVRRTVALSTAIIDGTVDVQGMVGRRAATAADAMEVARSGDVGVVVSPDLPDDVSADVVIDARLAKRNLDTTIDDAGLVVGIGPGFRAGHDCHAVIESLRGHHLGRVIWDGAAAADSGEPGLVGGRAAERVIRAPVNGTCEWRVAIGDVVVGGDRLGTIGGEEVEAPFDGVIRGLIRDGTAVDRGQKVGDVDPRAEPSSCREISDKSLSVGGGVLEAVLAWPDRSS